MVIDIGRSFAFIILFSAISIVLCLPIKFILDLIFKKKQCENLEKSIARRRNLLNNPSYVSKAPSHLVSEEREKLKKEEEELAKLIG